VLFFANDHYISKDQSKNCAFGHNCWHKVLFLFGTFLLLDDRGKNPWAVDMKKRSAFRQCTAKVSLLVKELVYVTEGKY
jgi:hypothetical protein